VPRPFEILGAIAAAGIPFPNPDFERERALLRSACAALLNTDADLIEAITVSLPVGNDVRKVSGLRALSNEITSECGLCAEQGLNATALRVRITRLSSQSRDTRQ